MNLKIHCGNVTGDRSAQVDACCLMERSRCADGLIDGTLGPLDAPDWLNKGRMVTVTDEDGIQVQFQQHTLRG
jgi:hypothetical protein